MRAMIALWVGLCFATAVYAGTLPVHPDKLVVTQVKVGDGIVAKPGMQVKVLYSAWLYDSTKPDGHGKRFDGTSADHPFTFAMGDPRLIKGWREGMAGMRVGGHREILIPSRLAYGVKGKGVVPPNAALVFDIRLLDATAKQP